MTSKSLLIASAITLSMLHLLPAIATAGHIRAIVDNGTFEQIYSSSGRIHPDTIQFLWMPEGVPDSTAYVLAGSCRRIKASIGLFGGDHNARFKKVRMTGMDSGALLNLPNKTSKVRQGLPSTAAVWDISAAGAEFAANDSAILVTAQVRVSKRVQRGDFVRCTLGVIEGDATVVLPASLSQAERRVAIEDLARSLLLSRPASPAE